MPFIAKSKSAAILPLDRLKDFVEPIAVDGLRRFLPPRIFPEDDIFEAVDSFAVLNQHDQLDADVLCPEQLRPEAVVILAYVATNFEQVLLTVDDHIRIV